MDNIEKVNSHTTIKKENQNHVQIMDGNAAAASVAYRCNDVIGIYPITPSSPMAEMCEEWSCEKRPNVRGITPEIYEMQSEAGAAGLVHGALTAGSMATSFTSSQGLLLMLPNMYKIAGELTPFVLHVAARTISTHALSIFCDHSDVMAARQTGFATLCGNSVQQAHDFALISQSSTLKSRVPFLHVFDGFRTSHELNHVSTISDEIITSMIERHDIDEHHQRRLTPNAPSIRGTSQNPDCYFQAREAVNPYYDQCADIVAQEMNKFGQLTGRHYQPFELYGASDAESLMVIMGSATGAVRQAVDKLNHQGEKVALLCVHLFRPFSIKHCLSVIPQTVTSVAVLDRTKEAGAIGDPLYLDILSAIHQGWNKQHNTPVPKIVGGRYGLASKEFTPYHAETLFHRLANQTLFHGFTIGITDDVSHRSIPMDLSLNVYDHQGTSALFYGIGSDGTVGANKNTIKIIGHHTNLFTQGYFVYDSKKSGGLTTSHLRFSDAAIDSPYLIDKADFIGCHQFSLLNNTDLLANANQGATVLFNSKYAANELWQKLKHRDQMCVLDKQLKLYTIDATNLANQCGVHGRINNIMQRAFFLLTDLLDADSALQHQINAVVTTYASKGKKIVDANLSAIEKTQQALFSVTPDANSINPQMTTSIASQTPEFIRNITNELMKSRGHLLPVSAFSADGRWPTNTSKWEKRDIAEFVPQWDEESCTQCNICSLVCPHSAIRTKVVDSNTPVEDLPASFKITDYKLRDFKGHKYTLQVSPEDCTGCQLCVEMCPVKAGETKQNNALTMVTRSSVSAQQSENFDYFTKLPEISPIDIKRIDARSSQLLEPLFEFSGACSGCGETPYIKLLTQLYGDHMLIANATGCSSIYGGNLPTTPYAKNAQGLGPAWANSLFEDNAEFGFGMRLALDSEQKRAVSMLDEAKGLIPATLQSDLVRFVSDTSITGINHQRKNVEQLKSMLPPRHPLHSVADDLVAKSVWIIGGDGWAFDIGYGGLDHVLSSDKNINVMVLNNQVYANTGGQQSKATPTAASAKFASNGKSLAGKDLGISTLINGNAYVASIAMGANMNQTLQAIQEAEAYPGPSLIIAYASCITHGIDMAQGMVQQKQLVDTGLWPLYRFDPRRADKGKAALRLDSRPAKLAVEEVTLKQNRFKQLISSNNELYEHNINSLQKQIDSKQALLNQLASCK